MSTVSWGSVWGLTGSFRQPCLSGRPPVSAVPGEHPEDSLEPWAGRPSSGATAGEDEAALLLAGVGDALLVPSPLREAPCCCCKDERQAGGPQTWVAAQRVGGTRL